MNFDQHRQTRADRLFTRAVHRFQAIGAVFVREDGAELAVELYRGRPSWTDDSGLGLRASAYVNWTCSSLTLARIKDFAGNGGFFGGCLIRYSGDTYQIDKLVPYVEAGLGGGYTIQTIKIGPDASSRTASVCC